MTLINGELLLVALGELGQILNTLLEVLLACLSANERLPSLG